MTFYEPCCDDHGWLLGTDGTPLEPSEHCKLHPEKRTPPKKTAGKPAPDKPVSTTRQGNQDKFAWFYEMLADPAVSNPAKVVGSGCVMKLAGHKGHFKATYKAIANLCGNSQSTVRRGLDDLIDKRYLDVEADPTKSAANTYHLIPPAQRCEEWLKAEFEYEREIDREKQQYESWLWAEKQWREKQFRAAVFAASVARGADPDRAQRITDNLVRKIRDLGLEFDIEEGLATVARSKDEVFTPAAPAPENTPSGDPDANHKRTAPCSPLSSPLLTVEQPPAQRWTAPCSTLNSPLLTPDAPTSANDQTHKSFKVSERSVKIFQDLESEPALRDALARTRRPDRLNNNPTAGECELCGPDGVFRDADGYPVVLLADDPQSFDGCTTHPLECQHSMAGNLAEIQRREKAENMDLGKTGWPEIDSLYPLLRD